MRKLTKLFKIQWLLAFVFWFVVVPQVNATVSVNSLTNQSCQGVDVTLTTNNDTSAITIRIFSPTNPHIPLVEASNVVTKGAYIVPMTWNSLPEGTEITVTVQQLDSNNQFVNAVQEKYVCTNVVVVGAGGVAGSGLPTGNLYGLNLTSNVISNSGLFDLQCTDSLINIYSYGKLVISATPEEIIPYLTVAHSLGVNQFIKKGESGVSLWALYSNELQVHYDQYPDGTKAVFDGTFCSPLNNFSVAGTLGALAPQIGGTSSTMSGSTTSSVATGGTYSGSDPNLNIDRTQYLSNGVYTVQRGDTVYFISKAFGVSMSAIISANNLSMPHLIYPGDQLIIP